MECRGTETRQWIVGNYDVVPVAHIQLLEGQTKHSDAGQTIENDYYIFEAVSRANGNKEIIQCGMTAARDFLRLLGHEGLPLFNPLRGNGGAGGEGGTAPGGNAGGQPAQVWNPVAKQLYNAIMWLIIIIDAKPGTTIFKIREEVYNSKSRKPWVGHIKGVNTIIGKKLNGKTLTETIDEFRVYNDIRDEMCRFDLLKEMIENYTDKEGNPVNIQLMF